MKLLDSARVAIERPLDFIFTVQKAVSRAGGSVGGQGTFVTYLCFDLSQS
jgi:hypothetical protein